MLLEHLGRHYQQAKETKISGLFFAKAEQAKGIAKVIHESVLKTESLSEDLQREPVDAH